MTNLDSSSDIVAAGSAPRPAAVSLPGSSPTRPEARQVGTRARRLQRRILLRDHSLEGIYWLLDQFLARPLVNLCRIVPMMRRVGRETQRACGVSLWKQVWDQVRLVVLFGAKPWNYYVLELYRRGAMNDVGAIILRNEVKHGLFKALNRIDPDARDRARALGDKLGVSLWCAENDIPHPHPIMLVERGEVSWPNGTEADLDRDLFVKRRRGRGGYAAASYWRTGPFAYRDSAGKRLGLDQIMEDLRRRSERERLMVMPLLRNHPAIADLAEESLIAIRVITCLDEELRPVLTDAYLRSITKLEPRWDVGRIEEFGAPIDLVTGRLGRMTGDKPECLSHWFDHHPVTGAAVTGRLMPCWPHVGDLAVKAHGIVPERIMIGWDMAVTPDGPMLLEGNSFADTIFPQRVFRTPIGHTRLGALLDFHMTRLEDQLDRSCGRSRHSSRE